MADLKAIRERAMRTTASERERFRCEFNASVASLGSGYQSELMVLTHNLCADLEDTLILLAEAREKLEAVELTLRPFAVFALHIVDEAADDEELLPDLAIAHFRNAAAILGGSE